MHIAARMPLNLIGGDRGPDAGAIDDDARVRLLADNCQPDRCCDVRIVDRIGAVGADVRDRQPSPTEVLHQRLLECDTAVVAADSHSPDVSYGRQVGRQLRVQGSNCDHSHAARR